MKNPGVILRCMQMLRMQQFFPESCHCRIILLAVCSFLVLQHVQLVNKSDFPLLKQHHILLFLIGPSLLPHAGPLSAHSWGYLGNPCFPLPSFPCLWLNVLPPSPTIYFPSSSPPVSNFLNFWKFNHSFIASSKLNLLQIHIESSGWRICGSEFFVLLSTPITGPAYIHILLGCATWLPTA